MGCVCFGELISRQVEPAGTRQSTRWHESAPATAHVARKPARRGRQIDPPYLPRLHFRSLAYPIETRDYVSVTYIESDRLIGSQPITLAAHWLLPEHPR